jgi:hypothetical protein
MLIDQFRSMNEVSASIGAGLNDLAPSELDLLRSQYAWLVVELQKTNVGEQRLY